MVSVLRKVYGGFNAPAKLRSTREASNGGKVRVCIIHGLTLVIKKSYTYCKSLLALEAKYYYTCP